MVNLMQGASDDQVALIGCLVALIGSASLMYVSFFVGPATRRGSQRSDVTIATAESSRPSVIALPAEASRERAA